MNKTNADTPSGFSILQHGSIYPFANSPGVVVAAIGLAVILVSLVIGFVIPKYHDLLSILRFLVAALIIIGCIVAANYLINGGGTSRSFAATYQNNANNTATCIFSASGGDAGSTFCLPIDAPRIMPNYGFVIMSIAVIFLLLKSNFPSPTAIRDALSS